MKKQVSFFKKKIFYCILLYVHTSLSIKLNNKYIDRYYIFIIYPTRLHYIFYKRFLIFISISI